MGWMSCFWRRGCRVGKILSLKLGFWNMAVLDLHGDRISRFSLLRMHSI